MLAQVTHFLPLCLIRRGRLLPSTGSVLVHDGQQVNAMTVLAETVLPGKHFIVDVYRALGISRSNKTTQYMQRKVGEKLQVGDDIAEAGGLFRKVIRSPVEGEIKLIQGGQVVIELPGETFSLLAGMSGEVVEVIPGRGAILETCGFLVQGAWGNGMINVGTLVSLAGKGEDELFPEQLEPGLKGSVVLSGFCSRIETLRKAAEISLNGLILGSMSSDLIGYASQLKFPIILVEGFGNTSMNKTAFTILSSNQKREVSLNACDRDDFNGIHPEITSSLPADGVLPPETVELTGGQRVRIHAEPYAGMIGTFVRIRPEFTLLSNGLRLQSADIRLDNNQQVAVPLLNFDVLE